jgi:Fe-S-cluster containining protein
LNLTSIKEYRDFIQRLDKICRDIQDAYAAEIACRKGCAGNCCRIHLSIFAVEAVSLASALKKLPPEMSGHIREKAINTSRSGPCPLLEDGACLMYPSRLVICRTHGLPMRTEYRGQQSIGFCQKNFQKRKAIPEDAVIDLDGINAELASLNRAFIDEYHGPIELRPRYLIGDALQIDF